MNIAHSPIAVAVASVLDNSMLLDRETARSISRGLARIERQKQAQEIARPMRELFDLLMTGEVLEMDGLPVMYMPQLDKSCHTNDDWCAIGPALLGWIDCWQRISPEIQTYQLRVLAERLNDDKPVTPRLVEKARAEFERTIALIPDLPPGVIQRAISTTQIAWELEKITQPETAAC